MRRPWYRRTSEEIYAYRTRRPAGFGTHWGYVGRTNDGARRDQEHRYGGGRWNAKPKPWAPLITRRVVLFRKKRRLELTTHLLELYSIRVLRPVYNVSMNGGNSRRIRPWEQTRQRQRRDVRGRPVGTLALIRTFMVVGALLFAADMLRGAL